MGSVTGKRLYYLLLGNGITSAELDEQIDPDTRPADYGKFADLMSKHKYSNKLLSDIDSVFIILGSSNAMSALSAAQSSSLATTIATSLEDSATAAATSNNTDKMLAIIGSSTIVQAIFSNSTANTNMEGRVGQSGSKIVRDVAVSSGNYTRHSGNGLRALTALTIGGGGYGNDGDGTSVGGHGGSGAGAVIKRITSLPSANTSHIVGAGGINTQGGAGVTASISSSITAFSMTGTRGGDAGNAAGGSTTNSGFANTLIKANITTAWWQGADVSNIGGLGAPPNGVAGGNGYNGAGGGVAPNGAGTSYGAGGASGTLANASGVSAGATIYGAGGGGASSQVSSNTNGGNGAPGVNIFYGIID